MANEGARESEREREKEGERETIYILVLMPYWTKLISWIARLQCSTHCPRPSIAEGLMQY